jgi:hypothetical protein
VAYKVESTLRINGGRCTVTLLPADGVCKVVVEVEEDVYVVLRDELVRALCAQHKRRKKSKEKLWTVDALPIVEVEWSEPGRASSVKLR